MMFCFTAIDRSSKRISRKSLGNCRTVVKIWCKLGPCGRYAKTLARAVEHVVNSAKPSFPAARRSPRACSRASYRYQDASPRSVSERLSSVFTILMYGCLKQQTIKRLTRARLEKNVKINDR